MAGVKQQNLIDKRHLLLHIAYWAFYILFFSLQRFAFYGFENFLSVLGMNLTYLPGVLLTTYFITEVMIPQYFKTRRFIFMLIPLFIVLFLYPGLAYLERIYIINPYVYNDGYTYSLYNFIAATIVIVFGTVPVAGLKIAQLFRKEAVHHELVEKEKLEAELKLRITELKLLRGQIQPHFLFNSLNSIQALIYLDQEKADKMLSDLSDLLRFSLSNKDKLIVPLDEELVMIRKYLSMEKIRFPSRLDYSIDVSKRAQDQLVISFLLQPFVENAIKHGMRSNPDHMKISIRGELKGGTLLLEISNTGAWIEPEGEKGTGIQNVIDRLNNAYPGKYNVEVFKHPNEVVVSIKITLSNE